VRIGKKEGWGRLLRSLILVTVCLMSTYQAQTLPLPP